MSVIIKGMKLPKNCDNCDLIQFDDEGLEAHCPLSPYYRWCGTPPDYRPEGCPLVEIPTPHGRLIDADYIKQIVEWECQRFIDSNNHAVVGMTVERIFDMLKSVPTIIEETEKEVKSAMRKAQKAVDIECDHYKDHYRFVELPQSDNHFADVGKKDTMSLTLALIVLDRLNTTERIDVARDNLAEAVQVVSAAAKYRIPQKPEKPTSYWATLKTATCPRCKYVVLYGIPKFCSHCGQALDWS